MGADRCVGCGKVLENGSKTRRTADGKRVEGKFQESKEWGEMHELCFDESVESPASSLARIRKLAKQATMSSGKKARSA